ncbi:MAG: polysaccharide deacetylase family protein [Bacteroidetes bacterium]|nr:polysaccharide deacetylase family protein [Bacteroidota bacterium]MBU1679937.1 polysaccharide deacetylase family protein [Bacteroidota bacterium]MBU2508062.1 polysaccharide deacetylase family protein [Bacteroidota bacterium]
MKSILYSPPKIIKNVFSNFIWETTTNEILLTFDDGPNPQTTELILKELSNYSIKAIFFCVGDNIQKYPSIAKEILGENHIIGNHTFTHRNIREYNYAELGKEIDKFNEAYNKISDSHVRYFRPPHGRFRIKLHTELNKYQLKNVMWSLLTFDYKNDLNIVKFAVTNYLNSNSIIVLHDNPKCLDIIIDSIKFTVDEALARAYRFGDPTECLK